MTAESNGVGRKFGYHMLETVHDFLITTAVEVSTSNTHTEEGVACKGNALFLIIEGDTTRCMTWGTQNLKGVMPETDLFAFVEEMTCLRILPAQRENDHRLELTWQIIDQVGIIS